MLARRATNNTSQKKNYEKTLKHGSPLCAAELEIMRKIAAIMSRSMSLRKLIKDLWSARPDYPE
jgi:hypothetical protein